MNDLYDQIMSILRDAGEFSEIEKNDHLAKSVRQVRQVAETELTDSLEIVRAGA